MSFDVLPVVYPIFSTSNHNQLGRGLFLGRVVYPIFSTSNHNVNKTLLSELSVVYPIFSTSNHNVKSDVNVSSLVVYPIFSTSNHNRCYSVGKCCKLYILSFLHQTTTLVTGCISKVGCISYLFYIKPQLGVLIFIITSSCISYLFYIKPQLRRSTLLPLWSCISYLFYIKPQPPRNFYEPVRVVYPIFSTSNHNSAYCIVIVIPLYILSFLHQTTTFPRT